MRQWESRRRERRAESGEPVVYFITGEFFADALNMPAGVEADDIKDGLRKLSIFLR